MCLNVPSCEVKNQLTFYKVIWFKNIVFVIQYIRCFKNFCGTANTFLHIPLKMENKMKTIFSPVYSLKLKNIILFLTRGSILIFFQMVIFTTLFRLCPTLWKSTLKMTLFRRWLNVIQIKVEIDNINLTLFNVVTFNVDVHNVVSTLIWHCTTSRRHINLKTTLKRRSNVC